MATLFNKDNFEKEVLNSDVPVFVDFWAEWCGPCRIMSPLIEEISKEINPAKLKIGKLNVDESPDVAQKYDVMSIPSFKIFKGGQVAKEFVGARSKEEVMEFLAEFLV